MVRPLHRAADARARPAERDRPGHRVAQGDGGQRAAQLRAADRGRRSALAVVLRRRSASASGRWRSRCSRRRRSSSAASGRSSWRGVGARRAMTGEGPRGALRLARARATAGATAATSCTSGWRCCSSASPRRRRSRTRATSACARADRREVGDYDVRYVRADVAHLTQRAGAWRGSRSASVVEVRRDGKLVTHLRPERGYYPSRGARARPGRPLLRGRGDERGRPEGRPARDVWAAMTPDIGELRADHRRRATRSSRAPRASSAGATRRALLGQALAGSSTATASGRRRRPSASSPRRSWPGSGSARSSSSSAGSSRCGRRARRRRAARRSRRGYARDRGARRDLGRRVSRAVDVAGSADRHRRCSRVVVLVVSAPLRRGAAVAARSASAPTRLAELEARKEAKYREIRDAELDYRTGKLVRGRLPRARPPAARRGDGDPARARPRRAPVTGRAVERGTLDGMENILSIVQVVSAVVVIFLVLMHSGQGRGPVGRVRRRHRRGPARRRLARRAQPEPLDRRLRDRVRREHDRPAEAVLLMGRSAVVDAGDAEAVARSAGHTTP